jgi:hypothetical protein
MGGNLRQLGLGRANAGAQSYHIPHNDTNGVFHDRYLASAWERLLLVLAESSGTFINIPTA